MALWGTQSEFPVTPSQGFLSDHPQSYLTAILDGNITRKDEELEPQLRESLEEQLLTDFEAALVELGLVLMTDSDALIEASGVLERTPDADLEWEELVDDIGAAGIAYLQLLQWGNSVVDYD